MDEYELDEIYTLLLNVMDAATKADTKIPLKKLEAKRAIIKSRLGGNASYKLGEAISSAESSAGRIPKNDKEHHRLRAEMHWSTFKSILARMQSANQQ